MKKTYLKKKIATNFSASLIFVLIASASIYFRLQQENKSRKIIGKIELETEKVLKSANDLKRKVKEINEHRAVFLNLSENKKSTHGIKLDDLKLRLKHVSKRHNISDTILKVSLPEELRNGLFDLTTVKMVSSLVNISFVAINDVEALLFISELARSLPGYVVLSNISIVKSKDYTNKDLINISSGKEKGFINAQVSFHWYAYKLGKKESKPEKEIDQIEEQNSHFR